MATLAASVVVGLAFLLPSADKQRASSAAEIQLPNAAEMETLSRLHDAHGATLSLDEPVAHRDTSASARAGLLASADAAIAGSL